MAAAWGLRTEAAKRRRPHLGFVGSSLVSPKAPPAGCELSELLRPPPSCRAVAVVSGSGEAELRRRAGELGVAEW